jgi:type I restriction enzyme S subunit
MGNITWDGAFAIDDLKWIDLSDEEVTKYTVMRGDLLFNRTNSRELVGKTAVWDRDECFAFAGYLIRVRFDLTRALPRFVSAFLNSEYGKGMLYAAAKPSINMSNISASDMLRLQVPLPPLSDQHRLVAILDRADAVRQQRRQAVEVVDELIPALFQERFGAIFSVNRHPVVDLGNCAEIVSGVTKGRRFNGQPTMMLPYLRVANVQDGRLNLSEIKTVEALPSDLEKLRLRSGDVLLTEGGDYDKLGRGALWEGQIDDCIHQNHIFRVRTDRTKLLPVVFANYLRTSHAKAYFLRCAKKTTNLATINMRQLRALPVPLPPVTQQQQFQEEYEVIRDLTKKCTDAFVQAGDMFASLAQRAFRGEL